MANKINEFDIVRHVADNYIRRGVSKEEMETIIRRKCRKWNVDEEKAISLFRWTVM